VIGELHRIVGEIFQRGAQPHPVADDEFREVVAQRNLRHEALGFGPHLQGRGDRIHDRAQAKGFGPQHQPARLGTHAVDDECRQIGKVLGGVLDQRRPLAFALGQIGRRNQFAERQNAVQRRADFVGERGERKLRRVGARTRAARSRRRPPLFRRGPRTPYSTHASSQPGTQHATLGSIKP